MRTALVTGSNGGIGSAVVEALQQSGYGVVGLDVVASSSPGALSVDLSSWTATVAAARRLAPIDILVNNAAVLIERPAVDISEQDFSTIISVNLAAPFILMRELVPAMATRGFGRVVNIASTASRTGGTNVSAVYAASKAGLVSLTKNFARKYAAEGITVNAVAPGMIDTPMSQAQISRDETLLPRLLAASPIGRLGTPEEVASVVCFLAGDDASYVNGTIVDVNGGLVIPSG